MTDKKENSDIEAMSYEQARQELTKVISDLEQGSVTLEASMKLWQRGEALAAKCEEWLSGDRAKLDEALKDKKA